MTLFKEYRPRISTLAVKFDGTIEQTNKIIRGFPGHYFGITMDEGVIQIIPNTQDSNNKLSKGNWLCIELPNKFYPLTEDQFISRFVEIKK
jgi:hypothetical protein